MVSLSCIFFYLLSRKIICDYYEVNPLYFLKLPVLSWKDFVLIKILATNSLDSRSITTGRVSRSNNTFVSKPYTENM